MESGLMIKEEEVLSSTPCSSPDLTSGDELSSDSQSTTVPPSLIGAENYITLKEGCQSAFTVEELSLAVENCKKLVVESSECSVERRWLVRRLIELRHRLAEAREEAELLQNPGAPPPQQLSPTQVQSFVKLGHHFTLHYPPVATSNKYCDLCSSVIWNVIQSYYECQDCGYKCHIECVESSQRVCAHLILSDRRSFEERICPEVTLHSQSYLCQECKTKITYGGGGGGSEARRCDYDGHHYCPRCHWKSEAVIPARVCLSWDFEPRPVCRASAQLLAIAASRPLISLDPRLYVFVQELAVIKRMREELSLMKKYLSSCRVATESGLTTRQLDWGRHLVHSLTLFSLNDLIQIHNGTFISKIQSIHDIMRAHIKEECDVCRGRGFICQLCWDEGVIFGFDPNTFICPKCDTVYHKFCWSQNSSCTKCLRKEQKQGKQEDG